jgi:hypothetical protein
VEKEMKDLESYINNLIKNDELWRFYKQREWKQLRDRILEEQHNECEICRAKGIIKRYDIDADGKKHLIKTVHHVKHVRSHPSLALSKYYYEHGERKKNLIVVCKSCHNNLHPEKRIKKKKESLYRNEERW